MYEPTMFVSIAFSMMYVSLYSTIGDTESVRYMLPPTLHFAEFSRFQNPGFPFGAICARSSNIGFIVYFVCFPQPSLYRNAGHGL